MRALLVLLTLAAAVLTAATVHIIDPVGPDGQPILSAIAESESPGGITLTQPVYTIIDIDSYDVTGTTEEEVLASMRALGPKSGDRDFFGLTSTEMSYRYWKTSTAEGCRLEQIRLDLHVVVTLPQWAAPRGAPYELKRDWSRFETALRRHEDGHREIAEWSAREVYHALHNLRTPTCDAIDAAAQGVADRLRETGELRQAAFDRQTHHGSSQGAVWPQSSQR